VKGFCKNCGNKIEIAIFKGGDWCSDDCRKALAKKTTTKITAGTISAQAINAASKIFRGTIP
jgi:ribosomal protein L37AE/L43A